MKKIIALFLAAAVFVLAGCSDTNKDYSVLLPFVNGSTNDKIEVTLAFVNNDSRMITGNPGASTAEAYDVYSTKFIKVKITDKKGTTIIGSLRSPKNTFKSLPVSHITYWGIYACGVDAFNKCF